MDISSSPFDAAAEAPRVSFLPSSTFVRNERSTRKRNVEDKDESSVLCNPRRSGRLMIKSADHSINQHPAPAPAPAPVPAPAPAPENRKKKSEKLPRKMLYKNLGPAKLNLSKLLPFENEEIVGCATLVLQNHSLQHNQNWHDWHILEIVEAVRAKNMFYLTFEAEKRDENGVRKATFEGHVLSTTCHRRVNGIRTLKPYTKWYRGKLWVPLIRPLPKPGHYTRGADELSIRVVQELKLWYKGGDDTIPLVPPERHGCDLRSHYKPFSDKRAGTDEEGMITPGTDPVYLELGKLSDSDFGILKDCATLAMHDHLIQIGTKKWREWCLQIVEAHREGLGGVTGYNYYLTFHAQYNKDERTLEAEVWDGKAQRRVNRFRAIMPRTTDWYPGRLWISCE